MAYRPTSGTLEQHKKANSTFALNYYLKYYAAGTTTAISCAANSSATDENNQPQLLAKVRINENGYPVNASGGEMVPHVDQAYKVVMFKNAADADADNVSAAYWMVDNLSPGLIGFTTTSAETDADQINYQADPTANIRKLDTRMKEMISVTDFGADASGAVDASTAFATAMLTNYDIYVPEGTYLTSGIEIVRTNQCVHFAGSVTLKAVGNDNYLFHQQKSYSQHTGTFITDSNGKSGVFGMVVGPADLTDSSTVSHQQHNILPGIIGDSGIEELVVVQPGPDVAGTPSLNQHNIFPRIISLLSVRGVWLKRPPNGDAEINRGHLFNYVAVQGGNTGFFIDSGRDNTIKYLACIDITSNGSPSTTATGAIIDNTCTTTSTSNARNTFLDGYFTGCNRDFYNNNATTRIEAILNDPGNSVFAKGAMLRAETEAKMKIYVGEVAADGTAVRLPDGWTSQNNGDFYRQVNHNLGHTNYVVAMNSIWDQGFEANMNTLNANNFVMKGLIVSDGTKGHEVRWNFILIDYS